MSAQLYPHPLHSFIFVPSSEACAREPEPHRLVLENGVLIIRSGHLRWARRVTTYDCMKVVGLALDAHSEFIQTFACYGMGQPWVDSMGYWAGRLLDLETCRQELSARIHLQTAFRKMHGDIARRMWGRLNQASKLAGLGQPLTRGRAPRAEAALIAGLQHAVARLDDPATARQLTLNGFGPGERTHLVNALTALAPIAQDLLDMGTARGETVGGLLVVRGALLGDLLRLSALADTIGVTPASRTLDLPTLLRTPRRWRPPSPGPAGPGTPEGRSE